MNSLAGVVLLAGITAGLAAGADVVFRKSMILDSSGKEHKVDLVFVEADKAVVVRQKQSVLARIPFDRIDEVAYGYSKEHRVADGAQIITFPFGVNPSRVVAGGIVMLTKKKQHWLYVDYRSPAGTRAELTLRLDKVEYQRVLVTMKSQTGQDVKLLSEEETKKK